VSPRKTKKKAMIGKARLKAGPATTIAARFHQVCAWKLRPTSSGGTSSSGSSPAIFTYPPSGSQATRYSVSPRVKPKIRGPKPMLNFSTFTLHALATRKCPSSCTVTSTPRKMMKKRVFWMAPMSVRTLTAPLGRCHQAHSIVAASGFRAAAGRRGKQ
jgi:hypothetical protein